MLCTTTTIKDSALEAVRQAWQERLETCFPDKKKLSNVDDALLSQWKEQTLAQVASVYRCYNHEEKVVVSLSPDDILACIDKTLQTWRNEAPVVKKTTAAKYGGTSFSLLAMGGLAAFFSWPAVQQDCATDEDIWRALGQVEYLEDVLPNWTTDIRPWIQQRRHHNPQACTTLYRQWYGKARSQESPEKNVIVGDMMEDLFQARDNNDETKETLVEYTDAGRQSLLALGLDMVTDFMVRKAACPPLICLTVLWKASFDASLAKAITERDPTGDWLRLYLQTHPCAYRQIPLNVSLLAAFVKENHDTTTTHWAYVLSLLAHILITVRSSGFPWEQWRTDGVVDTFGAQVHVYQLLSNALHRDPTNIVYQAGLEAASVDNAVVAKALEKA